MGLVDTDRRAAGAVQGDCAAGGRCGGEETVGDLFADGDRAGAQRCLRQFRSGELDLPQRQLGDRVFAPALAARPDIEAGRRDRAPREFLRAALESPVGDIPVARDLGGTAQIEAAHLDKPEAFVGPAVTQDRQSLQFGDAVAAAPAA